MTYTLLDDDLMKVRLERTWFGSILHLDVKVRWTKSSRQVIRERCLYILRNVPQPALSVAFSDDLKNIKFNTQVLDGEPWFNCKHNGRDAVMFIYRPLD